jgi:hypothetical protein
MRPGRAIEAYEGGVIKTKGGVVSFYPSHSKQPAWHFDNMSVQYGQTKMHFTNQKARFRAFVRYEVWVRVVAK